MKKLSALICITIAAVVSLSTISENVIAQENPIAEFNFDENSGTTLTDNSSNNDGTIHGATWTTGISGSALEFDGIADYVEFDSDAYLPINDSDRSVVVWIKPFSIEVGDRILSYGYWSIGEAFDIEFAEGSSNTYGAKIGLVSYTRNFQSAGFIPRNSWSQIGITLQNSVLRIYIDGSLDSTHNVDWNTQNSVDGWRIGKSLESRHYNPPDSNNQYYHGIIDDLSIYDRALSTSEISQIYNVYTPIEDIEDDDNNQTEDNNNNTELSDSSIDWTKIIIYLGIPLIICVSVVCVVYLIVKKPKHPVPPAN